MIVITGGIGSGKSVVCQLLRIMGYPVYDCDREARRLMNEDPLLKQQLKETFGEETYLPDGSLNKSFLASQIFGDTDKLAQMNALVHPAVAKDITTRFQATSTKLQFVETAIYYESGFSRFIQTDEVWCVAAPLELRIARAMRRDKTPRELIMARIGNQLPQEEKTSKADAVIWNDREHSIIEQINSLLSTRRSNIEEN